jgi:hypothetical protein
VEIVSSNSDADIERMRAKEAVEDAFRHCAINMLRVVAGAGKPYDLLGEMIACIEAARGYYEVSGHYPMSDYIASALDGDKKDREFIEKWYRERGVEDVYEETHRMELEMEMRRYGLRVIAAQMAYQPTIESNAKRKFFDSFMALERLREERYKRREEEFRQWRRSQAGKGSAKKKTNAKAKPKIVL